MNIQAKITDPRNIVSDSVVVFAWLQKDTPVVLSEEAKGIDKACGGRLSEAIMQEEWKAEIGNTFAMHTHNLITSPKVIVVGCGDLKRIHVSELERISASAGKAVQAGKAKRTAIVIAEELTKNEGVTHTVYSLLIGLSLGTYTFDSHKAPDHTHVPIEEVFVLTRANILNETVQGIESSAVIRKSVAYVRDLINEPPSVTTPSYLAKEAQAIAKNNPSITCEIFGPKEMKSMGMGGLLGIAQGSDEEPRFIVLRYKGKTGKTIALAGKGITFDTGGLSLKSSSGMESMKSDMAGAASLLGIFQALSVTKPSVSVVGVIAACENMPSGKAIKPGDIVKTLSGKTIEILNTDAEGRVVLSDALSYVVQNVKPKTIIDIATLTGACMVALGTDVAGLFSNNDGLADALLDASHIEGEDIWRLPLVPGYKKQLKSNVADIKNISGSKYGGAITAALFLEDFIPADIPWAHIDIAGPSYCEHEHDIYSHGGTGFGVRTILSYLMDA